MSVNTPDATQQEVAEIQRSFQNLALADAKDDLANCVPRPGFGVHGKKIEVWANLFPIGTTNDSVSVYHYDINIEPDFRVRAGWKAPAELNWKIWKALQQVPMPEHIRKGLETAAYDRGHSFYTSRRLNLSHEKVTISVTLQEDQSETENAQRTNKFKCTIQLVQKIDINRLFAYSQGSSRDPDSQHAVASAKAAINVLLRQSLYDTVHQKGGKGRRFFTLEGAQPMSDGGQVLNGFIQSVIPTQSGKPAVQLDTAYGAFFRAENLAEIVKDYFTGGGANGRGRGGGRGSAAGARGGANARGGFNIGSPGFESTVWQRFHDLKKLLLRCKYILTHRESRKPLQIKAFSTKSAEETRFELAGGRLVTVEQYFKEKYSIRLRYPKLPMVITKGKDGKAVHYPLKLMRLTELNGIPFGMISAAQTSDMIKIAGKPPTERRAKIMEWRKKLNYSQLPKIKEWCLTFEEQMMEVEARVLAPPQVLYRNRQVTPFVRDNNPLKAWSVVNFDPFLQDQEIGAFREAAHKAYTYGGKIRPQLIIVIFKARGARLYSDTKRIAVNGLKEPVVTQIMLSQKFMNPRGLDMYLSNVAMKVHAKLGGVTHTVSVPDTIDRYTMLVGADVTHPPPVTKDRPLMPSIAVSVAAINGDNNIEMIEDLTNMMKDHIRVFEKKTGSKPRKLLFFRDGVSEGQYDQCATIEIDRVRQAFRELDAQYKPTITMIICGKRHHMRFFATNESDTDGKTGNLKAGTCIDKGATHPTAFDFYLQASSAHAGLQGTARPTHYVVVVDENNFSADRMQDLCNKLCYSYARTTKAVSLIPVCYYADLIAFKARDFVYPSDDNSDTVSVITNSTGGLEMEFDPNQLYKRLEKMPAFNEVMWASRLSSSSLEYM
uniref:Argonaute n=1 Tax=Kwoniella dejecticola CBS 10117 TaxID=1296121 RepID=A0A1A6AC48_9TREE|nr:uncharacterized protein I303_01833 [Kwoniella dejecticola CBS 10117]OBR87625.1 hypothetical protein I303_01833 [Kwoniella dejecticola CBS 10117]